MTVALSIESIRDAALQLQPDARVQLARALVQSLDGLSETDVSRLWLAEAERRDSEMEAGRVTGISGDEVFRRIHARFGD